MKLFAITIGAVLLVFMVTRTVASEGTAVCVTGGRDVVQVEGLDGGTSAMRCPVIDHRKVRPGREKFETVL